MKRAVIAAVGLAILGGIAVLVTSCSAPSPRPRAIDPGPRFPSITATTLEGTTLRLPEDVAGERALILIGYIMESQFDIDRWLLGLQQAGTPVRVYELPTMEGMLAGLLSQTIDDTMRSGIPREDWSLIATVYGDAEKLAEFTGTERSRCARVVLLDEAGNVAWMYDDGYSAQRMMELDRLVRAGTSAK